MSPTRAGRTAIAPAARTVPIADTSGSRLKRNTLGAGGELQLTGAIALLITQGHPVYGVVHSGGRHDPGNPGGFPRAAVDFALEHPESGSTLRGRRDNS
jgi:UTP--glucose-1-phosphate uridylyltransferase